jgi:hypothetical protein
MLNSDDKRFIVQIARRLVYETVDPDEEGTWLHGIRYGLKYAGGKEDLVFHLRKLVTYMNAQSWKHSSVVGETDPPKYIVNKWIASWLRCTTYEEKEQLIKKAMDY